MSRMNKAELRAELLRLGEEPPASWTMPELRQRMEALHAEHGLEAPSSKKKTELRQAVIALNAHSKKKSELQTWCKQTLGMPVNGNETINQLQKAAMLRIYESTDPSSQDPVGFGKGASLTYQEIAADRQYCDWVIKTAAEGSSCVQLQRLAAWLNKKPEANVQKDVKMKTQSLEPELNVTKTETKKATKKSPSVATSSQASMTSSALQLLTQLTETVQDLKEEVQELRQDQPRRARKTETSDASFSMLSEKGN